VFAFCHTSGTAPCVPAQFRMAHVLVEAAVRSGSVGLPGAYGAVWPKALLERGVSRAGAVDSAAPEGYTPAKR